MEDAISLVFIDDDKFFIDGMKTVLFSYFESKGVQVNILDGALYSHADMVFRTVERNWQARFCQNTSQRSNQINFSLITTDNTCRYNKSRCISESGVIYRDDSVERVLSRIELALNQRILDSSSIRCYYCDRQRLTPREIEIIRYISWGMMPSVIARYLHINMKTVSLHKKKAMRKLGLINNADLYHWLRQGGLKSIDIDNSDD